MSNYLRRLFCVRHKDRKLIKKEYRHSISVDKHFDSYDVIETFLTYECDICGKSIVEKKYIEIPSYKDATGFEIYQLQQNGYIRRGWLWDFY